MKGRLSHSVAVCIALFGLQTGSLFGQPDTASINKRYREVAMALDSLHMTRVQVLSQDLLGTLALLPRDSFHVNVIMEVVMLQGSMLRHQGMYDEAEVRMRDALAIAKEQFPGNTVQMARAYHQVAWINEQSFDVEEWKAYLDSSEWLFQRVYPQDDCWHGRIWQDRARMNYYTFGTNDTTLNYLKRAERIYKECPGGRQKNLFDVHKAFYDVHLSLRRFDSADHYLRLQNDYISRQKGIQWDIQSAWLKLGQAHVYRLNGEYEKAITYYQLARSMFEQIPDKDTTPLLNSDIYTAWCTNAIGKHEEAVQQYLRIAEFAAGYAKITWDMAGLIYEGAARAYASSGQYDSAVYAAEKAFDAFSHQFHHENTKLLPLYLVYGNSLAKLQRVHKADSVLLFASGLAIEKYGHAHPLSIQINLDRCNLALQTGALNKGKAILDSLSHLPMLNQLPNLAYQHTLLTADLVVRRNEGAPLAQDQRQELITLLTLAMRKLRDIRNQYIIEESRTRSIATSISGLHAFMPILYHYYIQQPGEDLYTLMLQISETHRGLILSEAIGQSEGYVLAGIPTDLQRKERHLKASLYQIRKKIEQEYMRMMPKKEYLSSLFTEEIQQQKELEHLIQRFQDDYPAYYQAKFAHQRIAVTAIQDHLDSDEVLIEYLVVSDQVYVFVITTQSYDVFKLATGEDLQEKAITFNRLMQTRNSPDSRRMQLDQLGYELYRDMMQPFSHLLPSGAALILIPDRALHYFPFEIFLTTVGDAEQHQFQNYLISQYTIQYQSSIGLWMSQDRVSIPMVNQMLVVSPSFTYRGDLDAARAGLSPLEYALDESRLIHQFWGGRWLSGSNATKSGFMRHVSQSDMIHLATHAKADDRSGLFSWLAFSPTSKDSLLYLDEIYSMSIDARMVVLSGCETGIGPLQIGEGLISLSRAFSYAGAESIVTSLWPVHDAATSEIMTAFYGYLRDGESKDRALQLAKLDYLANAKDPAQLDPYYWAGFIAIGNMSPVNVSRTGFNPWVLILFLIVAFAGRYGIVKYLEKKKKSRIID